MTCRLSSQKSKLTSQNVLKQLLSRGVPRSRRYSSDRGRASWTVALLSQVSPGSLQTQVMEEEFQFLICQGCQKEPRNPKLLSCLHTLCADCLEENKPVGQCPICHAPIPQASGIPDQDNLLFANLQAKLSTYQKIIQGNDLVCDNCGQEGEFWCSDCEEFLCVKCFETHQRYLKRESHEAKAVRDLKVGSAKEFLGGSRKLSNLSCPNPTHANQMLSIYCRECQKPICCICALLDSRHTGRHCDIKVEIQQRQQELGSVSEELKKKEELFQDAYCNLKRKADHLDQVRNETQELIRKRVEQMVQLIREKEQELLEMVERQHHLGNEELEGKLQQTEAVLKRMGASKQLVEKMHLYASDQEVMDLHSFIKGSLEELRKLQPLAVGASIQAGGFTKCKARLQALFERVTGEGGTSAPQCAPPSEDKSTVTLSLEPLHPPEASHQRRHLPANDSEGLFSHEDPTCPPSSQTEPCPPKDGGGDVCPANWGDGSPVLPIIPPSQARRNGEKENAFRQLTSAEVEIPSVPGGIRGPLASEHGDLAARPRASVSQADSLLVLGSSILKGQQSTNRHLLSMLRGVTSISRSLHTLTSTLNPFLQETTSWWQAMQLPPPVPPGPGSPPLPETMGLSVPSLPSDLLDLFLPDTPEGSVSLLPAAPIAHRSSSHSISPPPQASTSSTKPPVQPQPFHSRKQAGERARTGEGAGTGTGASMDHRREAAPARFTDNFSKASSLSLPAKRKGVQTEAPAKVIKTEADAGKWEQSARKHQQNLLEQPGTSSSTSSSSSCVTDSFSAAKVADLLENNIYKLCEPDDPTGCLDSSEGDYSDEESTDSSLPDNINSVSCESSEGDLLAFPAGSPRELDMRQASLLFFDLKFLTANKILQLAVVDGEKSFTILIQPLKSLPGLISKGGVCEIGVKTLFHYLCSVHKPILAGYDLWSPALPVLFQSLDLLSKKEEFSAAVFGFLDILPLIKEKIPKAGSYKLKNLANTYIWRQLSDNSPLDNAKALRDLCTVLEVDPVEDPRPVLTCSNLECYASLQPLLNEKLLTKPSVQMLSMHNVSLSKLHTLYLRDPEKGLQKFCRFFNSRLQSSEKKIRKLSKIKAHFQSPQPSAGHQAAAAAAAANELPRAIKSEPDY
ncbi:protein PML-like isoform X2 [Mauremys mutica]|uniref:protein PML-like isoform X2 n=1 Tax=Mauremys mutica TaxID=74926 RepID=UPI001D15AB9D|nr:protein PML-like isoform X2 [Mauremys mutica]